MNENATPSRNTKIHHNNQRQQKSSKTQKYLL